MSRAATFARRVFLFAGIYGLVVLLPQVVVGDLAGTPIDRPEHFYGFLAVAIAWQLAFLAIGRDVVRLRPMMPAAIAVKLLFAGTLAALVATDRAAPNALIPAASDLALGLLFLAAWRRLGREGEGG